jgi:hypothetical protein
MKPIEERIAELLLVIAAVILIASAFWKIGTSAAGLPVAGAWDAAYMRGTE